jgi:sugar lactone lactonase YvrE
MKAVYSVCVSAAILSFSFGVSTGWAGEKLDRITGDFDAFVLARGLASPDSLARHPKTGEMYVSEESAGRISVIRDGKAVPVIGRKINVLDDIPEWAIQPGRPRDFWLRDELVSPEGIAFSAEGTLFVLEDVTGGRLLEFIPDAQGVFSIARVVPVPWSSDAYAWEGIAMARDGRLFLAGSSAENASLYESGSVLMRDVNGSWWIVDYGPFAAFASVALSRDEDILVVGDEGIGGVTWWDTDRQREIDTSVRNLANIEGVAVLPDGAILAVQESPAAGDAGRRKAGAVGRLIRLDPSTGQATTVADGFGTIESALVDPASGFVYVTEDSTGTIVELRPRAKYAANEYLLQRTVRASEAKQGVAPKKPPQFLSDFFRDMGVALVQEGEKEVRDPGQTGAEKGKQEFTLEELGAKLPMIAGKVKIAEAPGSVDADPVTEINFINLFPNRVTRSADSLNPSFCFFAAKHRSGKVQRTQPLLGLTASQHLPQGGWEKLSSNASLYLPLTACSASSDDKGVVVTMCFLGLGVFQDYYLTIRCGKENSGTLATDSASGQLVSSEASIVDVGAGGEEQVNVVMTGMLPKRKLGMGWLNIGTHQKWSIMLPERGPWISRWMQYNMPEIVQMMRDRDKELLLAVQTLPEELQRTVDAEKAKKPLILSEEKDGKEPYIIEDRAEKEKEPVIIEDQASKEREEDLRSFTNIILSKVFSLWQRQAF